MFSNPRVPEGWAFVAEQSRVGTVGFEATLTVEAWREPATRSTWVQAYAVPAFALIGAAKPIMLPAYRRHAMSLNIRRLTGPRRYLRRLAWPPRPTTCIHGHRRRHGQRSPASRPRSCPPSPRLPASGPRGRRRRHPLHAALRRHPRVASLPTPRSSSRSRPTSTTQSTRERSPRRKHWVTLIEADHDMAAVLAAVPIEPAVPLTEVGHANEPRTEHGAWFYLRSLRFVLPFRFRHK